MARRSAGCSTGCSTFIPRAVTWLVRLRWIVVPGYLAACVLVLWLVGLQVGTELFPQIDSGEFVLRFRPPPGSNFELTREMAVKCLEVIEDEAKLGNVEITMGFVGQVAPNFGINNMLLFMRGPDDGQLRVALAEKSGIKLDEFRERLRKVLPERVIPWLAARLEKGGLAKKKAAKQAKLSTFGFEPGDIVTKVMSFGSLAPIAVQVVGTDLKLVRQHAEKIAAGMRRIPFLRDVEFEQTLDYPTVEVDIDREKAGLSGVTVEDVAKVLVMATSSTRFSNLNYWIDVKTGFDYLVEVLVPPLRMTKPSDVEALPITTVNPLVNLMIRDVATVRESVRPGEYDRSMSQRYLTVSANVEGEDMGRASRQVAQVLAEVGEPPRGVRVIPMGQLPPMNEMFESLGIGLAVAVFVILVLLTAYFQSLRLALISISAVPGVLAGIAIILYVTNTSLNIESFMGSIMSLGVSVSNSVMLVAFTNDHWKAGKPSAEAAVIGASERMRPILMTACAMTMGMVPMALALERGSQMQAPLGRAVIGGLVMSTVATLLILPAIFAIVIGRSKAGLAVDPPGRPRQRTLRPAGRRRREHADEEEDSPASGRSGPTQPQADEHGQARDGGHAPGPQVPHLEVPDAPVSFVLVFGSFRRRTPAGALAPVHPRGGGLPRRAQEPGQERRGAPDRSGLEPPGPDNRPCRQPAEFHRELRADVHLSQDDRLYREVDRGHRRQGQERRSARHPLRARDGRGFRDEEGDRPAR